jgi:2-C-methyl-D-erythritol 4-phosphate cytidylyltransferase
MRTSAIVVAAGQSIRMGGKVHKPYIMIAGKPLLFYVLSALDKSPIVDEIILVIAKGDEKHCQKTIKSIKKAVTIVRGGAQRQDSVSNGTKTVSSESEYVLIQDGCRPFLSERMIKNGIALAKKHGASIAAIPASDTIKRVQDEQIVGTLDRKLLWLAQTPQVFRLDLIKLALSKAQKEGFSGTDDAVLVERLGKKVAIFKPDRNNMKIAAPDDLLIAEALIRRLK